MAPRNRKPERSTDDTMSIPVRRLINKYKQEVGKPRQTAQSREWFMKQASKLSDTRIERMLRGSKDKLKNEPIIGKLYMFKYDAIHKKELPYWDACPLVFFWDTWMGGDGKFGKPGHRYYIGINMHYLAPKLRLLLFTSLLRLRSEKRFRSHTRLKMEWTLLQNLAENDMVKPCVHIYRDDAFKTPFLEVPADQWEVTMFLPLARFQKQSRSAVWEDSRRKAGRTNRGKKRRRR